MKPALHRTKIDTVGCHSSRVLVCSNDEGTRMSCEVTRRTKPRWLPIILTGFALIASGVGPTRAQCVGFSDRASQTELDAFVKAPSSLLERLRNDKEKLRARLSSYIATNPSVLPSVQTLISELASPTARPSARRCGSQKRCARQRNRTLRARLGFHAASR